MNENRRLYEERLKLVLGGVAQSIPVGFFLSTIILITFNLSTHSVYGPGGQVSNRPDVEGPALLIWYVAFLADRIALTLYCRHAVRKGFRPVEMPGLVRVLLIGKAIEGLIWGSLVWIVIDENTSAGATALVLALLAAISSNAVALLSPIIVLYLALMVPALFLASIRFFSLDGVAYFAMGAACLLYVAGQWGQASLIGRGVIESIRLRFQNLQLIDQLKTETTLASAAREEAESANLAKSRFLAAASHDLRQPIHALGLFIEALSCGPLTEPQRRILTNAKSASLASTDMLNTLLDFSRIEAGVVQPKLRPRPLQDLLHKLEAELAPQADAKGLIYRSRDTQAIVISDPALLELILRNLISNAIRYTERGGVLVGCRRRGDQVSIEVYDTGIGIAEPEQREIFREFHQLGNPERDRRKGLGLGLAIVDGLTRSLGHRLTLCSRLGRGSVFRIEVPSIVLPVVRSDGEAVVTLPAYSVDQLVGRRVIVVDDDEAVRQGMQDILSSWQMVCDTAESLDEALTSVERQPPDAIICDYRLRERQTGADVIERLRAHLGYGIPALLITGDTAPERLREAMSSQIPLLHKPVPAETLKETLVQMLASPN
ncbi:ATP-binding response regulator [Pseudomonas sp. Marseille-QA0892]